MTVRQIQSHHNPHYKLWLSLLSSTGVKKQNQCLLSGKKIITEILTQKPQSVSEILTCKNNHLDLLEHFGNITSYDLAPNLFKSLDIFQTKSPLLVMKVPSLSSADLSQPPEGIEVLCPLGEPSNLGALIRSCHGFQASKIILLKESANPFLPKTLRASSGLAMTTPLFLGPSISSLPSGQEPLWAMDMDGKQLSDFKWPKNVRLLVGEEGQGLPHKDFKLLSIPMSKNTPSLNATMALTVALFHYRLQHPISL